ncbi:MAG: hypothetical protein JWN46_3930 [Acidimicrobiales bacterium]|nr:hypothetical protein [Acidimicrobiales bacterium]
MGELSNEAIVAELRRLQDQQALVQARLGVLHAENQSLRSELEGLRGGQPSVRPRAAAPRAAGAADPEGSTRRSGASRPDVHAADSVGRRAAIKTGIVAAGAAAAAAVLGDGSPAAAANGDALILGQTNAATNPTLLAVNGTGASYAYGLAVADNGYDQALTAKPAFFAYAKGSYFNTGLQVLSEIAGGYGTGIVVDAKGQDEGIHVTAGFGSGLRVQSGGSSPTIDANSLGSASGVAVNASSAGTSAVAAYCNAGFGVFGASTDGTGVFAESTKGAGMKAQSVSGMGFGCATGSGLALSAKSGTGGGAQVDAPAFHLRLTNAATRNAPTADTIAHQRGDLVETSAGDLWLCTTAGTPGTWRKVSGPATAGAFHVLASPVRVYDSRPGTNPPTGPKTPLAANSARTLDVTTNGSGVPADAIAAAVNLLLINTVAGNGNFTVWANGAARPQANNMVWGGSTARFSSPAISALSSGKCQVQSSLKTDLVLDIVGYYR